MENERPKFIYLYLDNEQSLNLLSDEDRGKLLSLLIRFAKGGEVPEITDNLPLAIMFSMMSGQIERDFSAYEQKCRINRVNGKKGGAPYGNQNARKRPKASAAETTQTTQTTETTQKEEEEKEKEKEKEKNKEEENAERSPAADADDAVIALFHRYCSTLPKVKTKSKRRVKLIAEARKQLGETRFEDYFRRADASDFLSGRSGKWKGCTFDWLLRPSIIEAVLDGFYDDCRASPRSASPPKSSYSLEELEKIDTLDFVDW